MFFSKSLLKKFVAVGAFLGLSLSQVSADSYDDSYGWVIGAGYVQHQFSGTDEFREATIDTFGTSDEITYMAGYQFYIEKRLGKDLYIGYQRQDLVGGYIYTSSFYEYERTATMANDIIYANYLVGLGSDKYWRIGGTAGYGQSTLTYDISITQDTGTVTVPVTEANESFTGSILKYGFVVDWGVDASGGRLGYVLASTSYDSTDTITPDGDGSQLFIDYRFAF